MNSLSPALGRARLLALLVPVTALGTAYASQYLGGLHPCEMCWWQRYPHMAAIPLALVAYALRGRACMSGLFAGFAGIAIGISGAIGLFHAGVEYGWWEGLTRCSTIGNSGDVLADIMAAPMVRCDEVQWSLFGISLAGWNAIVSLAGGATILALCLKRPR